MPSAHRAYADWTHERMRRQAAATGPATSALIETIMRSRKHPEHGFRSCVGIPRLLKSLARVELLVLDDWGLAPPTAEQRRDLLEIIDDRHDRTSTLVTSQLPVDRWHDMIGDPTLADAILDRLIHNAHRIALAGDSLRRRAAKTSAKPSEP